MCTHRRWVGGRKNKTHRGVEKRMERKGNTKKIYTPHMRGGRRRSGFTSLRHVPPCPPPPWPSRVALRFMTRALRHSHRRIQTHTHTPCAVSFSLWCRTQRRCCRQHLVSVSAAAGAGSQAQGKQANAACAMHSNDGDGTSTAATREHSRQNQDVQCS